MEKSHLTDVMKIAVSDTDIRDIDMRKNKKINQFKKHSWLKWLKSFWIESDPLGGAVIDQFFMYQNKEKRRWS